MSRPAIARVGAFLALALLAAAALNDRTPALVDRFGGTRIAWDSAHRHHYAEVTGCVLLADTTPDPRVAIWRLHDTTPRLYVNDTGLAYLLGLWDRDTRSIVVHPRADYWPTFRHEVIHERIDDPDHAGAVWQRAQACGFGAPGEG